MSAASAAMERRAAVAATVRARLDGLSPLAIVIALVFVVALFLSLYPTLMLIRGSLATGRFANPGPLTLRNYATVYGNPQTYSLFLTTVFYAAAVAVAAVAVGFLLAWVAVRTNAPLAEHMSWLIFIPYVLPASLTSVAWTLLANPTTGMLNDLARAVSGGAFAPFNIYTFVGMVFVSCTYSMPLAFSFLAAALQTADPSLEEAANTSGAGPLTTLWRISLPQARPAIVSMLAMLLILGLESFDVPAFIGIPAKIYVFTTEVFVQMTVKTPPDFGQAATYGILPLVLALALTLYYQRSIVGPERFATITGKAYRPRRIDLRGWRWVAAGAFLVVFVVTALLPVGTLLVVALAPSLLAAKSLSIGTFGLQNYAAILGNPVAVRAMKNTLVVAVVGATVAMSLAFFISFVTIRTRVPGRGLIEYLLFLPFAFPSIVLAVGVLWGYVSFPIAVYGTIWILMVGYVTKFLPYGLRTMSTSFLQVGRELEEVARTSGATFGQTLRRVLLPLTLPGLVAGWSLLLVVFMREFSISLLLWSSGSEVMTVVFWDDWTNGRFGQLGALGTLLIAASLAIVFGVRRLARLNAVFD